MPEALLRRCGRCGTLPDGGEGSPCARCGAGEGAGPDRPSPAGLAEGLAAPFRGAAFALRRPVLLLLAAAPFALGLALVAVLAAVGWVLAGNLAPSFGNPWAGWIEWARGPARWASGAAVRLAGALAGAFLSLGLSAALTAPLLDLLSERAEDAALGRRDPGRPWGAFARDAGRALRASLLLLAVEAAVMAPLFLLSLTGVGAPVFAAAGAAFAGLSAADVVLGRKRYPGRGRLAWAARRWPFVVGLGAAVTLAPPLAPFAVVGATLAYLALPEKG